MCLGSELFVRVGKIPNARSALFSSRMLISTPGHMIGNVDWSKRARAGSFSALQFRCNSAIDRPPPGIVHGCCLTPDIGHESLHSCFLEIFVEVVITSNSSQCNGVSNPSQETCNQDVGGEGISLTRSMETVSAGFSHKL